MSNQKTFTPAAVVFILVCISACVPVQALINQADNSKDDSTIPTTTQKSNGSNDSLSVNDDVSKVTQDEKGVVSSSSISLERLLLGRSGEPMVRRQTDGEPDLAYCTTDHIDPTFMEPSDCPEGGQSFRLCQVGKHKMSRCVDPDAINDYCDFCSPGVSFLSRNNNCTECQPCKICGTQEQVSQACTIDEDTKCEPKAPIPGPSSCPPCPVTQVLTSAETAHLSTDSTAELVSTTPYITSLETSPVLDPTSCPKCNCTDVCDRDPDELKHCRGDLPLHVIILIGLSMGIIIIFLICVIMWRERKYYDLEQKCNNVAEDLRIALEDKQKLKENCKCPAKDEGPANPVNADQPPNYVTVNANQPPNHINANHPGPRHKQKDDKKGKGGQVDLNISGRDLLDSSLNPVDDSLHHADVSHVQDMDQPLGGFQSLKSVDPRQPSAAASRPGDHSQGPPSEADLIRAEALNHSNGESSTKHYPERHENPGMEMSTMRSDKSLKDLNPKDTTDSLTVNETEAKETDEMIPKPPAQSVDSGNKTGNKNGGSKGILSKISPFKRSSTLGASAKTDKDVDRNHNRSVPGDKSRPKDLALPTNSSPKSPDAPGSIATPTVDDPTKTDKPEVGCSPSLEEPKSMQDEQHVSITDNKQGALPVGGSQLPSNGHTSSLGVSGSGDGKTKVPNGSPADLDKRRLDEVASELDFDKIANTLTPDELKSLYRQLGLERAAIEHAEVDSGSIITVEKAIAVLTKWKMTTGRTATRRVIIEALRKGKHVLSADNLQSYFISPDSTES
ncbi:uncharacterized protein [Amphiura filiformis]|uniref:uncharacterized protein n=1 Tax=Amphiura filiformis TaxID=82378 RepID=UPI003B20F11C